MLVGTVHAASAVRHLCPGTRPHSVAGCKLLGRAPPRDDRGLDGADQAAVGIVPQPGERVILVGPEHLVNFVLVLADLLERSHQEPADRLPDLPAVAPAPVGYCCEPSLQVAA